MKGSWKTRSNTITFHGAGLAVQRQYYHEHLAQAMTLRGPIRALCVFALRYCEPALVYNPFILASSLIRSAGPQLEHRLGKKQLH